MALSMYMYAHCNLLQHHTLIRCSAKCTLTALAKAASGKQTKCPEGLCIVNCTLRRVFYYSAYDSGNFSHYNWPKIRAPADAVQLVRLLSASYTAYSAVSVLVVLGGGNTATRSSLLTADGSCGMAVVGA